MEKTNSYSLIQIARIHCTLFSIVFGLFTAYILYLYTTIDQMKTQIISKANYVNEIKTLVYSGTHKIETDEDRNNLLERLMNLAMGHDKSTLRASLAKHGEEFYFILIALVNHYPFSGKETITFNSIEEISSWIKTLNSPIKKFHWIASTRKKTVHSILEAYNAEQNEKMPGIKHEIINDYNQMIENVRKTAGLSYAVENQIEQLENYKSRRSNNNLEFYIACSLFFMISILTPISLSVYSKTIPRWLESCISLWVPIFFYFFTLKWIFSKLV